MPNANIYAAQSYKMEGKNQKHLSLEEFVKMIDNPPYITHTAQTDSINVKNKIFQSDYLVENDIDIQDKIIEIDKIIKTTVKKQAVYVLNKMSRACGYKEKIGVDAENITGKSFEDVLAKISASSENSHGKEEFIFLTEDEIYNSSLESEIGKSDKKYFDYIDYDRSAKRREDFIKKYTNKTVDILLADFGYTKEEFDNKFDVFFKGVNTENPNIDMERLSVMRNSFVKEQMQKISPEERSESRFAEECDKTDLTLRAYVCITKNGIEPDQVHIPSYGSQKEFETFAYSQITTTASARYHESEFEKCFVDFENSENSYKEVNYKSCADYLTSLKNTHSKRPWFKRFVDFFSSKGESGAIRRMEKKLSAMEETLIFCGYRKEQLEGIKKDNLTITDFLDEKYNSVQKNLFSLQIADERAEKLTKDLEALENTVYAEMSKNEFKQQLGRENDLHQQSVVDNEKAKVEELSLNKDYTK